jgi:hypothetical protein
VLGVEIGERAIRFRPALDLTRKSRRGDGSACAQQCRKMGSR